jgi:hypothetical protein
MSELTTWARLLGGEVSGDQVRCPGPGHSATDRSLSVKMSATNGGFVVHSFAGNDPIACKDHVRKRLGMEPHTKPAKKIYFDYHDETGALVYQVEREDLAGGGKKIRQRRPDGKGGWVWNLAGVNPVPYRLPELLEALAHGDSKKLIADIEANAAKPGAIAIDTTTQALGGGDENGAGMDAATTPFFGRLIFSFSPRRAPGNRNAGKQPVTSGLWIRPLLFSASEINALIVHVAIVSRPRYIRGHGKRRPKWRASRGPIAASSQRGDKPDEAFRRRGHGRPHRPGAPLSGYLDANRVRRGGHRQP